MISKSLKCEDKKIDGIILNLKRAPFDMQTALWDFSRLTLTILYYWIAIVVCLFEFAKIHHLLLDFKS